MTWLSNALLTDTDRTGARVFYVSYAATRLWAAERDKDEPLVFSGWYWSLNEREAGPFKSKSAAWRDAWYQLVRHRPPPVVASRNDIFERELALRAAKKRRRKAPAAARQTALL